jgi:hypothetical protein
VRGGCNCGVSANAYTYTNGAQINFGDLIPYLTPMITTTIEATGKERSFEKLSLISKIKHLKGYCNELA